MIEPAVEQALRDDMVKALESASGDQYAATDWIAVCYQSNSTTITTNSTPGTTATGDLSAYNVRQIVDFMKKQLVPKYDGQSYICIASTQAISGLFSDIATGGWADITKYTTTFAPALFDGEVGRYYLTRFVEETGYLSNSIGASSAHGQAVFFGDDAVYEAVAEPEQIRVKVSLDYERDKGLAWYN